MIRVVGLMAGFFNFCENFQDFSMFLECPLRILGGFTWKLQKKLPIIPITNSKIY
jgi:hypothetical protein